MNKFTNILICIYAFLCIFTGAQAFQTPERMYVDEKEVCRGIDDNLMHIHIGYNRWITTTLLQQDITGMYTNVSNIAVDHDSPNFDYVRHWKCPYCFLMWPEGSPCMNPKCPSKYR